MSKRARMTTEGAAELGDQHKLRTIDLPCHAVVLSTRSDYFDRALRGGWKETETKVISINREDDNEAVMYFKLLIELSYCDSYIHDEDGDLLDREARVELAKIANEFEFGNCIEQCITSLCGEESTLAEQILFLEEQIPTALQGREVVLKYRERMNKAVVKGDLGFVANFF